MRDSSQHPNKWSQAKLSELIKELASGVSVNGEDIPAEDGEIGVLKVSAVSEGRFLPSENKRVTASDIPKVRMPVRRGDLIVSRANTFALIGSCGYVRNDHPHLYLPDKLWKVVLRHPDNDCIEWLLHALNSPSMRQSLRDRATGTSGSMKNIPQDSFLAISVLRPPLDEQKQIASILSTWDQAIELTEKRIAAARNHKDALMQRLFSGKALVPGFHKKLWRNCLLGDVAVNSSRRIGNIAKTPQVYSVTNSVGMVPMAEEVIGESIDRYKTVSRFDFAYNPMRINVGSVDMWQGTDDVLVSPDYVVFRCRPDLDAEFLNHFRKTHYWDQFVNRSGGGSVRVRIYFSDLAEMPLLLPPLCEQKTIAFILNLQDQEMQMLQRRLSALRRQKKGLMQRLLTDEAMVKALNPARG